MPNVRIGWVSTSNVFALHVSNDAMMLMMLTPWRRVLRAPPSCIASGKLKLQNGNLTFVSMCGSTRIHSYFVAMCLCFHATFPPSGLVYDPDLVHGTPCYTAPEVRLMPDKVSGRNPRQPYMAHTGHCTGQHCMEYIGKSLGRPS